MRRPPCSIHGDDLGRGLPFFTLLLAVAQVNGSEGFFTVKAANSLPAKPPNIPNAAYHVRAMHAHHVLNVPSRSWSVIGPWGHNSGFPLNFGVEGEYVPEVFSLLPCGRGAGWGGKCFACERLPPTPAIPHQGGREWKNLFGADATSLTKIERRTPI